MTLRRILIANRGEIAIRIARGVRGAGAVPLGVYSDADANAPYVAAMDAALRIGPALAADSYLDGSRIVAAARALDADAVHPGYGFLSERAPFAREVAAARLVFIGPPPDAIAAMGDKREAKRRAQAAGVPVVPGYDGDDTSDARLRVEAERIGVPLAIKATAGGGGRGLRVVTALDAFDAALAAVRREARAAFGDDDVILERYVDRPRHIEFQILADVFGTTIHLGERECSIQRRHQKLVEEAPSPALDDALRARMGAAAVAAARSVGYVNAGTVEFLLDASGAFAFLEMNARLQVEHPVTELAYGVDLVRAQLSIAAGEPLALRQEDVVPRGWAIEARVNAEDPVSDLPTTGTISRYVEPAGDGVRVDSGVGVGSAVTVDYDALLAKVVAFAPDRTGAVARLASALDAFALDGVVTNLPLLRRIARDEAFAAGATTTAFLAEREATLRASQTDGDDAAWLAIAAVLVDPRAWRIASVGLPVRLATAWRTIDVVGSRTDDAGRWRVSGTPDGDIVIDRAGDAIAVRRDDRRFAGRAVVDPSGVVVTTEGRIERFTFLAPPKPGATTSHASAGGDIVVAPMPGTVMTVAVRVGDAVVERDLLVVLEAMKMEHRIEATRRGTVRRVEVMPGAVVRGGATLVELGA